MVKTNTMKLKLLLLATVISCSLYSQSTTESIQLVYDTSGYLENDSTPEGILAAPSNPGDNLATVIPTVNAEMNVNEVGALTYMLPIEVLKGLNNFQPNLALVYSSQSGNGQAGYGWNITGTSIISRGGKSKEVDGVTIGPQFNNTDPFYLDGQRLIRVHNSDYVTEKFSKIKIQNFSSGEYSFIVKYTDGRIAKYKEIVSGSGQHYISVISDAFDNEIHYVYSAESNTPVLSSVSYGGTSVTTDKFFVNIYYKARLEGIRAYRNGSEFTNFKIVDRIVSSSTYNGTYRTYQLSHDYIENNSTERLRRITVSNENSEALKPLNFSYNAPSSTGQINYLPKNSTAIPNGTTGLGSIAMGDFFGSGEVEPIYQVRNSNNTYSLFGNAGRLNTSVGNKGNDEFFAGKVLLNNRISKNDQLITASTDYLGDVSDENQGNNQQNNTLIDRVTFYINDLLSNTARQVTVDLKGSSATHVEYDPYSGDRPNETTYVIRDTTEREFISGDFNNDGLIDFLIFEYPSINRLGQLYLVEIGKNQTASLTASKITGVLNQSYVKDPYLIEFDGDGVPELMTVDKYTGLYSVYKIDLENKIGIDYNSAALIVNRNIPNYISNRTPLFFGDFNGDGLTDFMTPHKVYKMDDDSSLAREFYKIENEQLLWNKFISTGKAFLQSTEDFTSQKIAYIESTQRNIIKKTSFWQKLWSGKMDSYEGSEFSTNSILVTDFNGDGRSDIIMINKIGKITYSTTGNLRSATLQNIGNFLSYVDYSSWPFKFINFNSKIANRISYIQNISGKASSSSTFSSTNNLVQPIDNRNYSPFTLIAPTAQLGQLNQYKSGVLLNDVLTGSSGSWVIDNDKFLEKQIQAVDNGSGVVQKVDYKAMATSYTKSEAPYYYNKEEADKFEYPIYIHNTNAGMYVAHKIHTEFDGKILTKEYRFENGVQYLEGKGFLGFQKTYVSDAYESEIKNGSYINRFPLRAVFWNISTRDPLKDNAVLKTTYGGLKDFFIINRIKNEKFTQGSQSIILATEEESTDNLKRIKINKRYTYDPADDFKLKKAYTDYDGVGTTEEEYTYKPQFDTGNHYFYGKIESVRQTTYRDNLSYTTREESDYFPNGNLQESRKYGNEASAPPISTSYTYDDFGNLKSQTISTAGIASQTTSYIYDATNRYVNKTTSPDGLFSESVVNPLGRVSEETSPLGLKTYYQSDSWGNITKITDYLGKQTNITKSLSISPSGAYYTLSKKREGGAMTIVTFDKFDREIQSRTQSINSKWTVVQTEYDIYGRKIRYSEPFYMGTIPKWNSIEYDELNRPVKNIAFTGKTITSCYEGMKVTVDDGYKKTSKTLDAMGNIVRHQDHGGIITFSFYPNGAPKETNYDGIKTTFEIDGWGNKKKIVDPSAGTFEYEYDNLSRITRERTPKGYTLFTYDDLGRPLTDKTYGNSNAEKTNIEKTYTYNINTKLPETITGQSNGKTFLYTTYYDQYYRVNGKREQTPDFTYTSNTTFDSYGRADVITSSTAINNPNHTTSSSIKNVYDTNGTLIRQNDVISGIKVWAITTINADGKMTEMEYGNGYIIKNNYRETDNSLVDIQHVRQSDGQSIVDMGYDYDVNKGILKSRNNRTFGKSEAYTYDKLNRLLTESVNNIIVNEYTYDQRGRMTSNTELGKYNYNAGDYKLQSINFNNNGQNVNAQRGFAEITFNAYRSPLRITLAGKDDLQFEYNTLKTRYEMSSSITGKQKFYSSDFAIEITKQGNKTEIITFITGDPYSANYIKKEILINGSVSESGNYFLHRDNQGSILAITKANDGSVVEKRYFDAWGNLKAMTNAQQQLVTGNPQMLFMDRGYTGHEHLQSVGLINMNARIYDPVVRKFLSADNLVSDPFNTQAYDRYSYVLNNPLLYMDLDGNEITLGVAVIIGVAVAIFSKAIVNMIQGIPFWYGLGKAATMGAVSAAISFGIGSLATTSFGTALSVGKAAFEAGLHGITSGAMSALDGGKFGSGFLSGMMSSLVSSGIQGIGESGARLEGMSMSNIGGMPMAMPQISNLMVRNPGLFKAIMLSAGGLAGGLSSTIAGGRFIDGLKQGLITSGLNHMAHIVSDEFESIARSRQEIRDVGLDPDANAPLDCSSVEKLLKTRTLSELDSDAGSPNIIFDNSLPAGHGGVTTSYITEKRVEKITLNGNIKRTFYGLYGTIGHELVHAIDTVSGFRLSIYNQFIQKGYTESEAGRYSGYRSEMNAYGWQMKHTPSAWYNGWLNHFTKFYELSQYK